MTRVLKSRISSDVRDRVDFGALFVRAGPRRGVDIGVFRADSAWAALEVDLCPRPDAFGFEGVCELAGTSNSNPKSLSLRVLG